MSPSRRAWLVWSVGIAAYIVAVLQRTSLGVAGLEATDRFETSASVLASFTVVQLVVYAYEAKREKPALVPAKSASA